MAVRATSMAPSYNLGCWVRTQGGSSKRVAAEAPAAVLYMLRPPAAGAITGRIAAEAASRWSKRGCSPRAASSAITTRRSCSYSCAAR